MGSPVLMDPHLRQQDAGPQNTVLLPYQEATKPKAKFKLTLPKKSEVD